MKNPILLIAPDKELEFLSREVVHELQESNMVDVIQGSLAEKEPLLKILKKSPVKVIISRGGTHMYIKKNCSVPVVEINITFSDIILAINEARKRGTQAVIIGYKIAHLFSEASKTLNEMIEMNIDIISIEKSSEIMRRILESIKKYGKEEIVFIGGYSLIQPAREMGCNSILVKSSKSSIIEAIKEGKMILHAMQYEEKKKNQFKSIINSISDGVIAVDEEGKITVINKMVEKLIDIKGEDALNKFIWEVIPNTRLHKVTETGQAEKHCLQNINGINIITNRVPVYTGTKITGAVATFQSVKNFQNIEHTVRKKIATQGLVATTTFDDIIYTSKIMEGTVDKAKKYALVDRTTLISAATGTGKEMFAQSIHLNSPRKEGPFVAINCAALTEGLLESELFGYSAGSFTGAHKDGKMGLFELAHHGTIFLDEISEVPEKVQLMLLRVLQEREVRRIGDIKVIPINVRVIAASNKDLGQMMQKGQFREDLFYRLNVLCLTIPPLSDRREDIRVLAGHFIKTFSIELGEKIDITEKALNILEQYNWPGNVRQLENICERLCVTVKNNQIKPTAVYDVLESEPQWTKMDHDGDHPSVFMDQLLTNMDRSEEKREILKKVEEITIKKILREVNDNKAKAAKILGISTVTLWRKLKKM